MKFKYLIPALLFFSVAAFASSFPQPHFQKCNPKGTICTLAVSKSGGSMEDMPSFPPEITVSTAQPAATYQIISNPTTGYTWQAKYNKSLLTLARKYVRAKPEMMGSGGVVVWTITATPKALQSSGLTTTIYFTYQRSWEKDKPPIYSKKVVVQIN